MENTNTGIIIIVALAALALVIFLMFRNKKDRRDQWPPNGTEDPMKKKMMDQQREQDKI